MAGVKAFVVRAALKFPDHRLLNAKHKALSFTGTNTDFVIHCWDDNDSNPFSLSVVCA